MTLDNVKMLFFIVLLSSMSYMVVSSFEVAEGPVSQPLKCSRMKDRKCGQEVGRSIFNGAAIEKVSDRCCGLLIHREKSCHDSIVQARLDREKKSFETKKKQVLEASTKVWNRCALIAQSLPEVKSCKSKLSKTCGIQIGKTILHNEGSISGECCIQLLKAGGDCQELLTLTAVAIPEYQRFSDDILKRSSDAWIKCAKEVEN